jgi:hypothetical protein
VRVANSLVANEPFAMGGVPSFPHGSEEDYEGLMETVHHLKSPANAYRLFCSIQEANEGEFTEHDFTDPAASE